MPVYDTVLDAVGGTPLVRLRRMAPQHPAVAVKLEMVNPGGSIKDRIAAALVDAAERDGRLRSGGTLVEATAGNTGIGLAMVAAARGYRAVFVVPDKMSAEKVAVLEAYGARIVRTRSDVPWDHPSSYLQTARRLAAEIPGAVYMGQFEQAANPDAHYQTTGPEIWEATDGAVTHLVAGVGTGGTLSGTARFLKECRPSLRVVAADPEGSVLSGGDPHPYLLEGIGEDYVPATLDPTLVDQWQRISDAEAFATARAMARLEGILAGGSAGAAVAVALRVAAEAPADAVIVAILPDSGRNYLTGFYQDVWLRQHCPEALAIEQERWPREPG